MVGNWLKAIQNLLVTKFHVSFLYSSFWKVLFDSDIDSPFRSIVAEIGFNPVFTIHDTFRQTLPALFDPSGSFIFRILAPTVLEKFRFTELDPHESPDGLPHSATAMGELQLTSRATKSTVPPPPSITRAGFQAHRAQPKTVQCCSLCLANEQQSRVTNMANRSSLDSCLTSRSLGSVSPYGWTCEDIANGSFFLTKIIFPIAFRVVQEAHA
jgi:hypothetical protein